MFDLFAPAPQAIDEANKCHAINYTAILIALETKGVITQEEYKKALVQATHIVDQLWAEKREEAVREFAEKYPNVYACFGKKEA